LNSFAVINLFIHAFVVCIEIFGFSVFQLSASSFQLPAFSFQLSASSFQLLASSL